MQIFENLGREKNVENVDLVKSFQRVFAHNIGLDADENGPFKI